MNIWKGLEIKPMKLGTFKRIKPGEAGGYHRMGSFVLNYYTLKKIFGLPDKGDYHKIDAEWSMKFADGTLVTIYNYKNGRAYNGRSSTPTSKIMNWNVGGANKHAFLCVQRAVEDFAQVEISNLDK